MGAQGLEHDFDQVLSREGTNAEKVDARQKVFGRQDVIPLWVADTDFAAPQAVTDALVRRAQHPVYGYSGAPASLYQSLTDWLQQRHGWQVAREQVLLAPGVVASMAIAVEAFTQPGEGVIIQPPIYPPFASVVANAGREVVVNPLVADNGQYRMDVAHLEACARQPETTLLMLCSPHNPVGRVWQPRELEQVLDIARRHGLTVVTDEVHGDLRYPDRPRHTPLGTLAKAGDALVTVLSPGKSFNIQGMGLSAMISARDDLREQLAAVSARHPTPKNPFSLAAFEAGYRHGGRWLDAMMAYVAGNRDRVCEFLAQSLPMIVPVDPEGTYLLWLDCRKLGLDDAGLKQFFVHQAGVGLSPGLSFGQGGEGFMRLNLATPRATLEQALEQIYQAVVRQA